MKFAITVTLERLNPTETMNDVLARALELVKLADQGGFDIVFTAEHHTIEFTISPNPLTLLTHWSHYTSNVRLGTATIVAPYWHPVRLAGEAALTDQLTNGRLELGIARGAYQYEFDRMAGGLPQEKGGANLRAIIPAIRSLWAGDVALESDLWSIPLVTSVPKPKQQDIPVWVAARDSDTFNWAVENGCDVMSTPLSRPPSEIRVLADRFEQAVDRAKPKTRPRFLMQRRTCVYDTPSDSRVPLEATINYGRHFENLFKNIGTVSNGFPEPVGYETIANRVEYDPENIRNNLAFGTPGEVIEKLRLYEAAGVDTYCYAAFGLPHSVAMRSLELFIEHVMPSFVEQEGSPNKRIAI